jgi:DNA-binding NarL/FixJ family response regulator
VLSAGPFDVTVAHTFDEAVALGSTADATVVDMTLADARDLLQALAARCGRVVIALTDDDHHQVRAAYHAGAHECIMASDAFDLLVRALSGTHRPAPTAHRAQRHPSTRPLTRATPRLTTRELEVLDGLLAGDSTKALAVRLQVSHATARTHVQSVLIKLGAHTRLEAVALVSTGRDPLPGSRPA